MKYSNLVFAEGVNQGTIDIVDGKAKSQNNHIFDHSWAWRVSITKTTRHIIAIRWGIHEADLRILQVSVTEEYLKIF